MTVSLIKSDLVPRRLAPQDLHLAAVLTLIRESFAGMDGRIDPPSSMHTLTLADLSDAKHEVWVIGTPPLACMVLTPQADTIYLGKLAVTPTMRGRGLTRIMVAQAAQRARALTLLAITLQTRIELIENQQIFFTPWLSRGRTDRPPRLCTPDVDNLHDGCTAMIAHLTILLVFQLVGEVAARALHLPLPGPVIGMVLLFVTFMVVPRLAAITSTARVLLTNLSLLFVPAGVGVVGHLGTFGTEGPALAAAILGSTVLAILAGVGAFLGVARLVRR